ncbi:hypothetical protein HU200_028873 [Digitaria exilis]|uniref:Uncharacterized protein n=1 Tax=Digitaria exilis TaxID=1010633 RepID=A0A835ETH2_9POAL|nr:hypothetical protein HU200_028873 [Digitaria exilis]
MAGAAPVYWRVLRVVQKHIDGEASKQHSRDFITAEFRALVGTEAGCQVEAAARRGLRLPPHQRPSPQGRGLFLILFMLLER